ncbi:replicative DNA helicase [Okeania sp. SIO2B3]|uniref:replicative DNA helicase n=1 Tax=Okeania sp. SIO2B3 TaxID=2607784 RepID=UPI0013C18ED0|nr:replicative DNA helicase [Okeania sp. SIO2B3]NET44652.1 replicative DNA helicase [Okeania sp. SIO2B3]
MKNNYSPPQNIEAEESILGGILLDPNAINRVADLLSSAAFYIIAHQRIYQAALELYHQDKPTDLMTVTTWLKDRQLLEKVGGQQKLAQLVERTISAVNIDSYAALVIDKYQRRLLIGAAREIEELGYDTATELPVVIEQSEARLFQVTVDEKDPFQPQSIDDCLRDVFNELEQGQSPGYLTGLADLDRLIGGLARKDLIIIAGRASMGKTWFSIYLANYVTVNYQVPVIFFSAEMSKNQLTKRFLAMHSGIDSARLIRNQIYRNEYEMLVKGLGVLRELPIIIDDTPAMTLTAARMRSVLRRIKAERGTIGLVVMDYIQKLGDRAAGNRAQVIGKFSGAFKDMAKEFDCPFIALAQINRGVEGQLNKRPLMSDIKDSGDIEQDMDLGILLYRDEYYNPETKEQGILEINVAKNRNGTTGMCKVKFNPIIGAFLPFGV